MTDQVQELAVPLADLDSDVTEWIDVISRNQVIAGDAVLEIKLEPYDVLWIRPDV